MNIVRFLTLALVAQFLASGPAAHGQGALDRLEETVGPAVDPPELPAPAAGRIGYLGMSVNLLAPSGKSILVKSVTPGGPAAKGGLKASDVILSINNREIHTLDEMDRAVRQPPGTKLQFKVRRDGVPQRCEVVLGARAAADERPPVAELPAPARPSAASAEPAPVPARNREGASSIVRRSRPSLGISVVDITDLVKRRFGVVVESGAVISRVREGTPAYKAGLPLGGVIVSVNGKKITSANDIIEVIQAFRPGDDIDITYQEGDRIGRKRVRLGVAAPERPRPTPRGPGSAAAAPEDPPLRMGRRRRGRPILEALERTLDIVLPPAAGSREDTERSASSSAATAPPPPPLELEPPVPVPGSAAPDPPVAKPGRPTAADPASGSSPDDLAKLRQQMEELQQQLERLQRHIKELERGRAKRSEER